MTSSAAHHSDGRGPRGSGRRAVARGLAVGITIARPGASLADAVPFAVGGLAVAHPRLGPVLLLGLAGMALAAAGRLLDAVTCLGVDRINPARRDSPLVRGEVGRGPLAALAVVAALAVAGGGLLAAPTLAARIGFVVIVALRVVLAWLRGRGGPLRWPLAAVTLAGGLPLGVLTAGGSPGAAAAALSAGFGLGALIAGCTVADLRDLPTDRITKRRTAALARGVHLRRPAGFVLPPAYVALVCAAQVGFLAAVSTATEIVLAEGAGEAAGVAPSAPSVLAASAGTPGASGGGLGAGRAVAALAAVAAGLAGAAGLVRLLRSGAPGLDPIRSARARGGGFVRLNLLAVHLGCVAWLVSGSGGLLPWVPLALAAGWSLALARWSAVVRAERENPVPRAPGPDDHDQAVDPAGATAPW